MVPIVKNHVYIVGFYIVCYPHLNLPCVIYFISRICALIYIKNKIKKKSKKKRKDKDCRCCTLVGCLI